MTKPPCPIRRRRNPGRSVTNLRRTGSRIFSVSDSPVCADDTQPSARGPGRVASGSGSADLRAPRSRSGSEGGCFPGNDTGFPGDVPDPTRPPTRPRAPRTSQLLLTIYMLRRTHSYRLRACQRRKDCHRVRASDGLRVLSIPGVTQTLFYSLAPSLIQYSALLTHAMAPMLTSGAGDRPPHVHTRPCWARLASLASSLHAMQCPLSRSLAPSLSAFVVTPIGTQPTFPSWASRS